MEPAKVFLRMGFQKVTNVTLPVQKAPELLSSLLRVWILFQSPFFRIGRSSFFQFTLTNPTIFVVLHFSTIEYPTRLCDPVNATKFHFIHALSSSLVRGISHTTKGSVNGVLWRCCERFGRKVVQGRNTKTNRVEPTRLTFCKSF